MPAVSVWLARRLTEEGPAELFALMRIGAVLVTWSRLGGALVPHEGMGTWGLWVATAFWAATVAMVLGHGARIASLVTAACVYAVYVDHPLFGDEHLRSHHVMAQGLLCFYLAFTPCDRAFVFGRPLRWSRPGPVWGLHLMRLQLAVMYVGATWEKAYPGWMSGARMEQILMRVFTGSDPLSLPWRGLAFAIANGTVILEGLLCVLPLLALPARARWATYVLAVAFHAAVYALTPVATFSATMAVFWLAVLPVDGVRDVVHRLLPRDDDGASVEVPPAATGGFLVGTLWLLVLAGFGGRTPWLPDRGGFQSLGEDVCVVVLKDGRQLAGERDEVKRRSCKAGPMRTARCVVDGAWAEVRRDEVCAPVDREPRRREPAR